MSNAHAANHAVSIDTQTVDRQMDIGPTTKTRFNSGALSKLRERIAKIPKRRLQIVLVALALAVTGISYEVYQMLTTETTDDAFISARVHSIGSRVNGTVQEVLFEENQIVKKGDVLIRLDPADFQVQVQIAQAGYYKAHKYLGRWAGTGGLHRDDELIYSSDSAGALISDAQLKNAQLQLKYTEIIAPEDGKVGKRSVESGQQVIPGLPLLALVELKPWIEANFKENQVAHLRVGQTAEISIDAIPEKTFQGHIDSISPGSGSTFALLPPDNATGNFTKIVQRIPVKIVFDTDSIKGFENRITSGMSSEIKVFTH
jgi:membrane fusion protein (multidrug efflux system)